MLKYLLTTCMIALPVTANSALLERLGGLAYYDEDADLTWLTNANTAGIKNWGNANAWATGLNVSGVSDWRLPTVNTNCIGVCTTGEFGNMFYNVLGGATGSNITSTHNANYYLFTNIQSDFYWSSVDISTNYAWGLYFDGGYQNSNYKPGSYYAWAVHSGDVGASIVPIPSAVWLFGSGLLGLIGVARRKADA